MVLHITAIAEFIKSILGVFFFIIIIVICLQNMEKNIPQFTDGETELKNLANCHIASKKQILENQVVFT